MSFCTNCSTFVFCLCRHNVIMYDDAFIAAFIWCYVVLCPIVLREDALSFHIAHFYKFLVDMCECVYVYS